MTGILDLPAELIVHIVSFLDDEAIFNTRLSNQHLESSSLSYVGKRFFRKKGYLITTSSLNVLKSISQHTELRKYVQHVWFNPDCYTNVEPSCTPEEEIDEDGNEVVRTDLLSEEEREQLRAYDECTTDHAKLLYRMTLTDELKTAFSNLPNLLTIGMRRSEKYKPWGWKQLADTIKMDPRAIGPIPSGPRYFLQAPTKLFVAIINAVADSPVRLKRLYTDVVEIDNILPEHLTQETLDKALRSVLYLEFNASRAWLNSRGDTPYLPCKDASGWGRGLVKVLKAVPALQELGLQIFPDVKARREGDAVREYPYVAFETLVAGTAFDNLTRLKLEKVTTTSGILELFLTPCAPRLTSLKMREIRLIHHSSETQTKSWYSIFNFLHSSCPNLAYLLLHHLWHNDGSISFVEDCRSVIQPTPRAPGPASFVRYEHITLEAKGRRQVEERLKEVCERHWYEKAVHSYPMDEDVWHTDTSDEEW